MAMTITEGQPDLAEGAAERPREPIFRLEAAFVAEGGSREYEYELRSDGREVESVHEGGRTLDVRPRMTLAVSGRRRRRRRLHGR